jgi:hypothetical protein
MNLGRTSDIDAHVHLRGSIESLLVIEEVLGRAGLAAVNALVLITEQSDRSDWLQVPAALLLKLRNPGSYAFSTLDYGPSAPDYAEQARTARALGFDGMKLYHGKPTMRRHLGFGLDDPRYDGFYRYAAEERFPVLHHVGDPATHWDPHACPSGARRRGWCYADSSFVSREALFEESERVLARHPDAPIILAHFAFLGDDRPEAERLLAEYPSLHFDLAPGWEIYQAMSTDSEAWATFFGRYRERILLGSDNSGGRRYPRPQRVAESVRKLDTIRAFLGGGNEADLGNQRYRSLRLARDAVKRIAGGNFTHLAGGFPRAVDVDGALGFLGELSDLPAAEALAHGIARFARPS